VEGEGCKGDKQHADARCGPMGCSVVGVAEALGAHVHIVGRISS